MKKAAPHPGKDSRWPQRLAVLLACVTFPLIWVGGLVTTYDAGMAVPDWPGTYGYNLLLYPWQTWVFGPWDLFIEHGHRLLGALAGMVAIALVAVTWRYESRQWVRWLSIVTLMAVIFQGCLGGARVLLDERQIALIHGCFGPAFFCLVTAMIVVTSRFWRQSQSLMDRPLSDQPLIGQQPGPTYLATAVAGLGFVQLLVGAQLRHLPISLSPYTFRMIVLVHLVLAAALVFYVGWTLVRTLPFRREAALLRPALLLAALTVTQVGLGMGTWVSKYAWPGWLGDFQFAAGHTVQQQSLIQSLVVTGHVAAGSLILATSVFLALRCWRLFRLSHLPSPNSNVVGVVA